MTRLARVDMDAVAPLYPSDKVAGRVAARGEHFEWEPARSGKVHSDLPLAHRAPTERELADPTYVDLSGATIGRLKVIGVAADVTSRGNQNWVVRCVCGAYETRKGRYIKACAAGNNPGSSEPMCDACGYTRKLQLGYHNPKKAAAAAEAIQNCIR
ncbi:hypothetical protein [Rhizobium ruizarguesonis]|uniref:hypothetical protein n=1 Tax=Rhizobium ruizarguesonis TaxID=2081791 RepID=UPI00040AEA60|nr:hypothetical protein [Rhizobium ruizarguesonis]QJS27452.1 hypothetical protein RLTA1_09210 [Rhizobium leguminosarum bv. trifolii TA1]UFW96205.1 hypothetical protein RlegTA1_09175 [Rhizobium ruizarguesonis]